MIYHEHGVRSHQVLRGVQGTLQGHQGYQSHPAWATAPCRSPSMQEITESALLTVLTALFLMPLSSLEGEHRVEVDFLCPAPLNDFEGVRTLQRRNSGSAVPVLISSKSFRCSALLEIKLITINDLERWELSFHGTPYSSIFHIKFKWKSSLVKREDCWKGSNIKKTWATQLN